MRTTYDICMKRTTIFLPEDLEHLLQETARRSRKPQAEIVREALTQYLAKQARPWPRSVGMASDPDESVDSANVKEWIRGRWRRELDEPESETSPSPG